MEDNYENEDYVSLAQIIKVSIGYNKKSKIRFTVFFVVILIAAVLGLKFGYNNSKYQYSTSFYYDVNGFDDNTYLDGSNFNYNSLVSLEQLTSLKASNSAYSSIDIDKLYKSDGIKITFDSEEDAIYKYTITASKKYFKSDNQAKEFIQEIVYIPIDYTNSVIDSLDYAVVLNNAKDANTYENEIAIYSSQAQFIITKYNTLIEKYKSYILSSGTSLNDLVTKVNLTIENLNIDTLETEVSTKYYVKNFNDNKSVYEIKKSSLENDLVVCENKIKALQAEIDRQAGSSSVTTLNGLNDQLGALLVSKEDINNQISNLEKFISNGDADTTNFDKKLTNVNDTLTSLSKELASTEKELYQKNQYVYYSSSKEVKLVGGFSTVMILVISVLAAAVIAVGQNLVIDYKQLVTKKETKKDSIDLNNENKE